MGRKSRAKAKRRAERQRAGGSEKQRVEYGEWQTLEDGGTDLFETRFRVISGPLDEAVCLFKERIYQEWLDEPDPALGFLTPRDAVKSAQGRTEVLNMIEELELVDRGQSPPEQTYDFDGLRRELGL